MAPYREEQMHEERYTPDPYETQPFLAGRPSDAQALTAMPSDSYSFASGSSGLRSQPQPRRPLRHSVWSLKMDSQRRPSFHMARNNSYSSEHTLSPIGSDDGDDSDRDIVDEEVGEEPPTELPVFQEQKSKLERACLIPGFPTSGTHSQRLSFSCIPTTFIHSFLRQGSSLCWSTVAQNRGPAQQGR